MAMHMAYGWIAPPAKRIQTAEPQEAVGTLHVWISTFANQAFWRLSAPAGGGAICERKSVLLLFIFLLFREDFLDGYELSHDILCTP